MTDYFDKLNLRPMERRLVIGVIIVVFVVLNVWFVWPQFKEWDKVQADFDKAKKTLSDYRAEIRQMKKLTADRDRLIDEGAAAVVPQEMGLQLRKNVQNQVNQSGVVQNGISDVPSRQAQTGNYFDETSVNMKFLDTGEQELVDFLYNISAGKSMIRVRDLTVSPNQALQKLQGDVTLTASYQKNAPPKPTPTAGAGTGSANAKSNAAPSKAASSTAKAMPAPAPTQKKSSAKSSNAER